jgi:predicted transcriptional regulator
MKVLPQEIEVWYVIPAIRKALTICLVRDHGLSYEKVGNALGISKAAISQYHKNKRAAKVRLPSLALEEVGKSCKRIVGKKGDSVEEIQRILGLMRKRDLKCGVCEKEENGILKGCKEVEL